MQPSVNVGDLLAAKYRVERVLGRGGMGVVVAARHVQIGSPVAIKLMLPSGLSGDVMRERFLREARAAARLRGEHIARIMDFGTLESGAPYIVMELLEGSDLAEVVKARGKLPVTEAVDYVLQACKAMEEAHAQGIVHRDLKPQNLFLTHRPDGTPLVKVVDFGISKLEGDEPSISMTASSSMLGSPLYMSPEQMRSAKRVDHRADIYSLGVVLYQLTSGALPIEASSLGELFEKMFMSPIPTLRARAPELAPALEAVVMRCLEKEPSARFPSIRELSAELAPFLSPGRALMAAPAPGPAAPAPSTMANAANVTASTPFNTSITAQTSGGGNARRAPGRGLIATAAGVALAVALGALLAWAQGRARRGNEAAAVTTETTAPMTTSALPSAPTRALGEANVIATTTAPTTSPPSNPAVIPSAAPAAVAAPAPSASPPDGRAAAASATASARPAAPPGSRVKPAPARPKGADPFGSPD